MSYTDWSFLSYHLATHGIPCDIEEIITDDYEMDPWRPKPKTEAVTVTVTKDDAGKLAALVALRTCPKCGEPAHTHTYEPDTRSTFCPDSSITPASFWRDVQRFGVRS
jgi:hypothetical protein